MERQEYLDRAKEKIKKYFASEEFHIVQEIKTIDLFDDKMNELIEQMKEWQISNWPEIQEKKDYLEIVAEKGLRDKKEESKGAELDKEIGEIFKEYAKILIGIRKERDIIKDDLEKRMKKYAPEFYKTAGGLIGARMLTHFSLERLARMPASTIQMIGAEKALFRHIKTGALPPKHGYIYGHPDVENGKDARQLANKIMIAVRKDYFGGRK